MVNGIETNCTPETQLAEGNAMSTESNILGKQPQRWLWFYHVNVYSIVT